MSVEQHTELRNRGVALREEADRVFLRLNGERVKERFQQQVYFHLDDLTTVVFPGLARSTDNVTDEQMWLGIGEWLLTRAGQSVDDWRALMTKYGDNLRLLG